MSSTICFFVVIGTLVTTTSATLVQPEWMIYYNMTTNQTIDIISSNNPRIQYYKTKILRIGFGPIPCSCQDLSCGCCAGIDIQYFDFNRRTCMNFTYEPYDFALNVDMYMNEESLFSQQISGKNPPPACMPVPLPLPFAPTIDLCLKFFNIHTSGYNLFMCVDFETRIARAPILVLHFDCMKMGVDGIQHLKPEDGIVDPVTEDMNAGVSQPEVEIEVYDEVFEDNIKNQTTKGPEPPKNRSNSTS